MRFLGIHGGGHDCGTALVVDGVPLAVLEMERHAREKRVRLFPGGPRYDEMHSIASAEYGTADELTAVGIQLTRYRKESFPLAEDAVRRHFGAVPTELIDHHACHAAAAFYTSPFEKALILSFDGWGNDGVTVAFLGDSSRLGKLASFPVHLGAAYRALGHIVGGITDYDLNGSGKAMGFCAYGRLRDEWVGACRQFILDYRPRRDEPQEWEPGFADAAFRLPGFGVVRGSGSFGGPSDVEAQDFAATFQFAWSSVVLDILRGLVDSTSVNDVCLTGGCALNVVTNRMVADADFVRRAHFIPNPSDSGIAMGAALYMYYVVYGNEWAGSTKALCPFLGSLPETFHAEVLDSYRVDRPSEMDDCLVDLLSGGKVIGLMRGRAEVGPRALGHRSILADPRSPRVKERINARIKRREWYRPFAPVVRVEDCPAYFELPHASPYMSLSAQVRPEVQDLLPGITHFDGSTRPQTVDPDIHGERLDALLSRFGSVTGTPVLLNTSLNAPGRPIASSLADVLPLLVDHGLDAISYNDLLIRRLAD